MFLVTEQEITGLQQQLEELEQLNLNVTSKIPCSQSNSTASSGRMRELLECPVCLEEMRPPKKIFQVGYLSAGIYFLHSLTNLVL